MAIELETERRQEILAECVEMTGGDFEGHFADIASEVTVNRSGEVVHGGRLTEVRVNDNAEFLELFEDAIHG